MVQYLPSIGCFCLLSIQLYGIAAAKQLRSVMDSLYNTCANHVDDDDTSVLRLRTTDSGANVHDLLNTIKTPFRYCDDIVPTTMNFLKMKRITLDEEYRLGFEMINRRQDVRTCDSTRLFRRINENSVVSLDRNAISFHQNGRGYRG